jgi:hypothetical protein
VKISPKSKVKVMVILPSQKKKKKKACSVINLCFEVKVLDLLRGGMTLVTIGGVMGKWISHPQCSW